MGYFPIFFVHKFSTMRGHSQSLIKIKYRKIIRHSDVIMELSIGYFFHWTH